MIVSLLKRLDVLVVMCFRVHDFCSDFLAKNIRGIKTGILVMAYASLSGFFFPKLRRDFGNAAIAILFLILFFWQLPHFLSIAWMCRSDYARAKLPTLSVLDTEGGATARQMILNVCALVPVSLLPTLFGITGTAYFFGAFVLGFLFSAVIAVAAFHLETRARWVLRASVVYLTILLMFMVLDRV